MLPFFASHGRRHLYELLGVISPNAVASLSGRGHK
jgi:hypothetical protein